LNSNELSGLPGIVNHIGDVDFYNGKLIAPVQYFSSCANYASPVLAVYDASNGSLLSWSDISADGHEVSSVTVVSDKNQVVVSSFCGANQGDKTLWIYDLGAVLNNPPGSVLSAVGTIHLSTSLQTIQGISWNSALGQYLVSTDLGGPGGTLWYIAADGTVSGPAFVLPQTGELEGVDFTTGNIYYLINGYVYCIGSPVTAPTFSVGSGTYTSSQSVTISDSDSNAAIHYTLDGSMPKVTSPVYSAPISVSRTLTLKAIATVGGSANSPMVVATYTIN